MESLKGKLLLAHPFLKDPSFKRMVVLICNETAEGHYGLVLNNPMEVVNLDDVLPEKIGLECSLGVGGPVDPTYLQYLHRNVNVKGSQKILPGLCVGGDFKQVKMLLNLEDIRPNEVRFYVGYAGWSQGQLEEEMKNDSWLVTDFKWEYLENSRSEMWKMVLRSMGKDFSKYINYPIDPRLN
jgi:putative transcriptional regulator